MVYFRGYTYSWRNRKRNGTYWTCSSHHKKGCRASVTTDESKQPFTVTSFYGDHNHPAPKAVAKSSSIRFSSSNDSAINTISSANLKCDSDCRLCLCPYLSISVS
ncbi:hypothetical protein ABMA27_001319 [Loxostege sticticalis]|uniref:FLYWCH-type domain-containing protein n=1 Tax=Loxostege sticticalis TaxID=481309 RepID=A0ABR3HY17_LOXSC